MGAIGVIGVAAGLGAPDQGCADGPAALGRAGLVHRLRSAGQTADWRTTLVPSGVGETTQQIVTLCQQVRDEVTAAKAQGQLPVVVGGDHSYAVGVWSGVMQAVARAPGLLWIDAHMDSHTPATSPSGCVHGMPLACLLGYGEPSLVTLVRWTLDPRRLCLFGVRSYEPEEAALLARLGGRVVTTAEIARRGWDETWQEALAIVSGPGGYGVTVDLDAVDPGDAPGVGSPVPAGLEGRRLCDALAGLGGGLQALEVAEYNPHRDREQATAQLTIELIAAASASKDAL